VLLMFPLKMMLIGFGPGLLILILAVVGFLAATYFCIHWLEVPTSNGWIALYALFVWLATYGFDYATDLHLEVLVPAFALGCVIKSDHLHGSAEYAAVLPRSDVSKIDVQALLDWAIKGGFMLLAGMALPPITLGEMSVVIVAAHVVLITIVSNIGKCVPLLVYPEEATARERLALSIGMFPRGEGGHRCTARVAGNLSPAKFAGRGRDTAEYGRRRAQPDAEFALTGIFIIMVIRLLNGKNC
jgi:hypothetical protein